MMQSLLPDTYRSALASPCLDPADTRWVKARVRVRLWSIRHDALISAVSCLCFGVWYGWMSIGFLDAGRRDFGVFYGMFACVYLSIAVLAGWMWVRTQRKLARDGGDW